MIFVDAKNKSIEYALSEFKKRVKRAGVLAELKSREFYRKPSAKRKLKRVEAHRRRCRDENLQRKLDKQKKNDPMDF